MFRAFLESAVRYHRGLRGAPTAWKPWLVSLLIANMIAPWFWMNQLEAQVVFGVACLNYLTFILLTGLHGFSRILGLAHVYWIPLLIFLWTRLATIPPTSGFGAWIRIVILLDAGSVLLDVANVVQYIRGDRAEMFQDR